MKKFKSLIASVLVVASVMSLTACSKKDKVKEISTDEFIEACEEMGFDEVKKKSDFNKEDKVYYEYSKSERKDEDKHYEEYIVVKGRDTNYEIIIFDEEYYANEYFERAYYAYDDDIEDLEGDVKTSFNDGKNGYVTLNVEYDSKNDSDVFYGGIYYSGTMIITASATDDSKISSKSMEEIDDMLDLLGLPKP